MFSNPDALWIFIYVFYIGRCPRSDVRGGDAGDGHP